MNARVRGGLERVALILLGVVLETLAQPPGGAPILVFAQDAPFFALLWHRGGERWKRWAFLYAFVKFAFGLRWLSEVHPGMPYGAAAVLATLYLLWAATLRFLVRRRVPFLLAAAVTAVLEEMGQTVVQGASGMPWPARSLAFAAWEGFTGAASILGAYGLSALAAATSGWLFGLASLRIADGHRAARARRLIGTGAVLALVLGATYARGAIRVGAVDARLAAGDAFTTRPVVVVQANIEQRLKNERGREWNAQAILERHKRLTTEALLRLADRHREPLVVVWPETMIPWPFCSPALAARFPEVWESEVNVIGHLADAVPPGTSVPFLVGANYYVEGATGRHDEFADHDALDSYFYVDPARLPKDPPPPGAEPWLLAPGRHDKSILVPWGEYTPGGSWLAPLKTLRGAISIIPELTAGPGDEAPFLLATLPPRIPGRPNREVRAGTIVCFEVAFPSCCRAWRNRGAGVLVNAANYAWYGDTGMPAQVLALAKLRAAETSVAVVIAGNSGPTAILDPAGRVTAQVEVAGRTQFVEGSCAGPLLIDPDYRTLYAIVGDVPWWVAGAALLLLGVRRGGGRTRAGAGGRPGSDGGRDTAVTEKMAPADPSAGASASSDSAAHPSGEPT